ncbi:hypothetical protein QR685DRAFT_87584 [Neurospora intermedia]|uniref:Secreted protein n=1 Tax=Neurospora intermedia TaxID=5142 RepID=A0ABR3D236_NEUIN
MSWCPSYTVLLVWPQISVTTPSRPDNRGILSDVSRGAISSQGTYAHDHQTLWQMEALHSYHVCIPHLAPGSVAQFLQMFPVHRERFVIQINRQECSDIHGDF